jgi:hypothetical protein
MTKRDKPFPLPLAKYMCVPSPPHAIGKAFSTFMGYRFSRHPLESRFYAPLYIGFLNPFPLFKAAGIASLHGAWARLANR